MFVHAAGLVLHPRYEDVEKVRLRKQPEEQSGADDGDRTRYLSDHNRALDQMSFIRHDMVGGLVAMSRGLHGKRS